MRLAGRPWVVAALLLGAVSAPSGRTSAPTPRTPCEFRTIGLASLWDAGDQLAFASARRAAGEHDAARQAGQRAVRALRSELARAVKEGKPVLGKAPGRAYRRDVAKLLGAARRAARTMRSKKGSPVVSPVMTGSVANLRSAAGRLYQETHAAGCTPAELRVTRLFVAAAEERRVTGGTRIVAAEGVGLAGSIVVEPAGPERPGCLTIVAERGDVVLGGSIVCPEDPPVAGAPRSLVRPRATEERAADADPLVISALTGNLVIQSNHFAIAGGRGADAPYLFDVARHDAPTPLRGIGGGNGADIVLEAQQGTVTVAPRLPGDPLPFKTGNGGHGQFISLAADFETPWPGLTVVGGPGGNGGLLRIALGRPASLPNSPLFARGSGIGGNGGEVYWRPMDGTRLYRLTQIELRGGRGGDGMSGGTGGTVGYAGRRVLHEPGLGPAPISVTGGDGGSALEPRIVTGLEVDDEGKRARGDGDGGWGGFASALGGKGRDGQTPPQRDGQTGGAVVAQGGSGGGAVAPGGRGGDGGLAAVETGSGGDGYACDPTQPGGNGGAAGTGQCHGGDGGPSLAGAGGKGGNARVTQGVPGVGGEGDPPGQCGPASTPPVPFPGRGGDGTILGPDGEESLVIGECGPTTEPASCKPTPTTTIPQCCPAPCRETEPENTSLRTITFQEPPPRALKVTAVYDSCGNRDQFGNCAGKYTFTCSEYGQASDCIAGGAFRIITETQYNHLLFGGAFCGAPGVVCAPGPGTNCTLFGGATLTCVNCGNQPVCDAEAASRCRCANFDDTGIGTTLKCDLPPSCNGPRCP